MPIIRHGYKPPRGPERNKAYGYNRKHWQTIRAQRLALDGHICTYQYHPGCTITATTVDLHDTLNGNHDQATIHNTRSACRHCHGIKDGGQPIRPYIA